MVSIEFIVIECSLVIVVRTMALSATARARTGSQLFSFPVIGRVDCVKVSC